MNKKYIIGMVTCLFFLLVFIGLIIDGIGNVFNIQIESREVWITSDVVDSSNENSSSYFVRYDDHHGETGILYTDENGNGLSIGDSVTVYRSIYKSNSSDSTHSWTLSKKEAERQDIFFLVLITALTIVDFIILCIFIKKLRRKKV